MDLLLERFPKQFPKGVAADEARKDELSGNERAWIEQLVHDAVADFAGELAEDGAIAAHVEEALEVRVRSVLGRLGISFDEDMFSRIVADYARIHAYDRGVLVAIEGTTKLLLGNRLEHAIERGLTYEEVADDIAEFFEDLEDWETLRIARTEIATAARMGNLLTVEQAMDEAGIVVERVYLHTAADACEDCQAAAQYTRDNVVTVADAQAINDDLHPNCRCDFVHEVRDAEAPLRSEEESRMELLEELGVFA